MSFENDNCELVVQLQRFISPNAIPRTQKLFARTFNALRRAGLTSTEEVMASYPKRLLRIAGFGPESLWIVEMVFFLRVALRRGQKNASMANPWLFSILWPTFMVASLMQMQAHPAGVFVAIGQKMKPRASTPGTSQGYKRSQD